MKLNEDGQALVEFVMFVPFLVFLFILLFITGNAINNSINQQKATRGYFYFLAQNDSLYPGRRTLSSYGGLNIVSMDFVGWKDRFQGGAASGQPVSSCQKFPRFFPSEDNPTDETCEKSEPGNQKSGFIRAYTVYGLCTADFSNLGNARLELFHYLGGKGCVMSQ